MDLHVVLLNIFTIALKNCAEGSLGVRDVNPTAGTGNAFEW